MIAVFDLVTKKLLHTLEGHALPIRSLAFSPDSTKLVSDSQDMTQRQLCFIQLTGSDDGHIKLYDVVHATVLATMSGHTSWVLSVAFSPETEHFVSGSSDGCVKVRRAPRGRDHWIDPKMDRFTERLVLLTFANLPRLMFLVDAPGVGDGHEAVCPHLQGALGPGVGGQVQQGGEQAALCQRR